MAQVNNISLTIINGGAISDWVIMPASVIKLLGLKTPSNTPNTTLVFEVRTVDVPGIIYPVVGANNIAELLMLNVNGLGAFGGSTLLPLSSYTDGYHEIRFTLGAAITGDGTFLLSVPSTATE